VLKRLCASQLTRKRGGVRQELAFDA
jgi:hypothetical protein